jgi:tRNA(Ile)-lysidine synthase
MPRANLVETVLRACRDDAVLAAGGAVVVAVSGGPDSTALLHALHRAAPALGLRLTAAHLDHAVRRESRRDARRVAELCAEVGVSLVADRIDGGRSRSENTLRRARYRFLEEAAVAAGAGTIALGHTADDQAETVLLHLIRGAGLEGLGAMPARQGMRFRPLLGTWRAEVEAYCRRQGLEPLDDPSNQSRRFTRNRVRLDLIPEMARYNPRVKESLVRLADAARDEHAVVAALADVWLSLHAGGFSRASLAMEPTAVQVETIRRAWSAAADGDDTPGDAARLRQAVHLIVTRSRSKGMLDLGRGLTLAVDGDHFHIVQKPPKKA